MVRITTDDIYGVLNNYTWKSSFEIHSELGALKGVPKPEGLIGMFRLPYSTLYVKLLYLEKRERIESRWREIPEEVIGVKGGAREREYRRKPEGNEAQPQLVDGLEGAVS